MISLFGNIISFWNSVSLRLKTTLIRKLFLVAGCWLLGAYVLIGQTVGDFRTNGNVDFASNTNWQRWDGIAWVLPGAAPVSTDGLITIQNGHTATITGNVTLDQIVVNNTGILTIDPGQTLTIANGSGNDLDVSGTVNNSGSFSINGGANIVFNASSIYNHTRNGGAIPNATWDPTSNCNITGITTSSGFTGGLEGQTFGNFTWNCPSQNTTVGFMLAANFTVAGDFKVLGTGPSDPNNNALRMSDTPATVYTIHVKGNFVVNNNSVFKMNNDTGPCFLNVDGDFTLNNGSQFVIVTGPANSTLTVSGNTVISGLLDMQEESVMTGTMNVGGNLSLTAGGIIQESNNGIGVINFYGNTTHTYSKTGGSILNIINFNVLSPSILNVGTSTIDGSDGTFNLNSGAGIITAHPQGLSTTAGTGSIQVTGTKTFNSGADYTYNGSVAQQTGNGLAGARNLTISNNNGVTLTSVTNLSGTLFLSGGNLTTSLAVYLLITNTSNSAISGGSAASFINGPLGWTLSSNLATGSTYNFPLGKGGTYLPFSLVNPTTGAGGAVVGAEAYTGNAGGTIDATLVSRSLTEYWQMLTFNSFTNTSVSLARQTTIAPLDAIAWSSSVAGTYTSVAGTAGTYGVTGSNVIGAGNKFFVLAEKTQTISTSAISGSPYCAGASVSVPFTITGTFNAGNVFTAQLSNATGSFASPVALGTLTSTGAGTISGTIPAGTLAGSLYRIRVVSSSPVRTGTPDGSDLTINQQPVAQTITKLPNETDVCVTGSVSATFSGGSGGVTPSDVYESSVDAGTNWVAYIPGNSISSAVAGANRLQIRTQRTSVGTGCSNSGYNFVTWNTVGQPIITTQPSGATVCYNATQPMSVVVTGGALLSYQWQVSPNGIDTWTNVGTNSPNYTSASITSNRYYKVIISSTGSGCNTPLESNPAGVLLETVIPTITCPVAISQNDDFGSCNASVVVPNANVADNCSVSSLTWTMTGATIASSPAVGINQVGTHTFNTGVTTVTYIVKDAAGNQATCLFTVTITDNINPTITCPANIVTTTSADGAGNCTATATLGTPTTTDNCSVASVIAQVGAATINPATYAFPTGVTTVTWIVTDGSGRTASCNQTVTVTDDENPTITCPANVVTTTSADGAGNCTTMATLGTPTTADNCSVASVIAQVSAATINPATYAFPIGVTTVTWIVTDGSGRTASCNQTVTVTDDENPTITCPANIVTTTSADGAGNCTTTATLGTPTTADNCSVAGVIAQVGAATINPATYAFPTGVTTVTWIVTDGSGRTASCNQTVTVTDDENPTITCPANIVMTTSADGAGNCTTTATLGTPTTADNCSVASVIAQVGAATINPATYAFPIGVTTVTWIVTDGSGRTASCNQTVTVTDDENPTITCPANIVTTTSADGAGNCTTTATLGTPTTADNCSVASVIAQVSAATINPATYAFPTGVTTVTWIVTDGSGRTASCNQTVTVTDDENPTITCPANIVTTTSADGAGNCTTTATPGTPTTADNCSVASVIAQVGAATINPATYAFPAGVTTVTWIVTDGSGRTASCNQTVTVTDDENPTITCPANIVTTTSADGSGNCTTTATLGTPTTADNCSVAGVIAQVGAATINPATYAFPIGVTTVTWIVTDGSGRTASCNQTVTVTDDENPTITCPANIVTTTSADGSGNCTTTATLGTPTTADNCSVAGVIAQVSAATINPATYAFPIGVTTVTWIVTDGSGRTASCNQTVTVTDDENPTITCPANIVTTTSADATGNCTTTATLGTPTTADNCSVASVIAQVSAATINPATYAFPAGVTTVTWIVTDGSGRTASCNQTVTVTDDENPTITCPANIIHTTDAGLCSYYVSVGVPVTGDNCGVSTVVGSRSDLLLLTDTYPTGLTTIHWVVTDLHGNTNTCDQTVTVNDTEAPSLTCPVNVTISCEDNSTPSGTGFATATDNCTAVASIAIIHSDISTQIADPSALLHYNYTISRTWRATDAGGNYSECTQIITVQDVTDPVITCPAGITIDCEDDNTPAGTGTATATDICTPVANIEITSSGVSTQSADPSDILHYNYTISRTWKGKDVTGNYSECIQTITVHDITKPVITCPANVTVSCEDDNTPAGTGTATATDICTPVANITITHSDLSTYDADPSNVLHYNYIITRTWRATDVAGNFSECTQTITVHDITRPVITCPSDDTLDCEDDNTPVGTGTATATDICTPVANITITHTDVSTYSADPSSVLHYNYSISRIWRATDVAGNYSECTQTITVHDITQPVITCPSDVTINCEDDNAPAATGTATATDICTPVANIGITHSDVSTQSADPSALLHYNYTINRTWRATDVAGNYSECTQNINVQDVTVPVITCPGDRTINCEDDNTPAGTGTATVSDNCTPVANILVTYSDVSTQSADPSDILHYNYTISRTWKGKDVAGNYSECTQTITVHDITKPVITCPANITVSCEDDNTSAGTGTAAATDICTPIANITITHSDLSTYDADPSNVLHYNYTIARTWRATDVAGNFSECTQTITVHDITRPVITCPSDVTLDCEDDNTPVGTGTATATDICTPGVNITVTHTDVSTYSADPSSILHYNYSISRTWRATDVAGNLSECTQTITVHDITQPVITCPSDVTINCEDDNAPSATGTATATDICTPVANIAIIHSDVSTQSADPSALLHYNYTINRTWRATDVAGNYSECTQNITVQDVTVPVITCPGDRTINCEDDNTPAGTGTATVSDNCTPVANILVTYSDVSTQSADPSDILHYNYTISRTWKGKDVTGNYSECIQTITVHDITKPVITCPANVTVSCEEDNTPAVTGTATATDICTPVANITITHSDLSTYDADPSNVLHYNYTIARTWRATDPAGNFSECTQTITVHDITRPVITCPSDVTLNCEDDNTPSATGTATASDICTPVANITITHTDVSTYSADPSSILHYNYSISRTWRATDVAGNYSECTQTITVHDITQPVITCPSDVTINCEDDNAPAATGTATATDICTPVANIAIIHSDVSTQSADPSALLHYNYTINRTWRATDVAGNYSECTQIITVQDVTNPVITCPADRTIDCEDDNTPAGTGVATAADNCTPEANIAITHSDASTQSGDPSDILYYNYTITRTWRATDVTGNFSECIQTITVHDITKPVITCPANITVSCEDDNTPAGTGTATATDICTPVANITITHSDLSTYDADPSNVLHYNYTIARTWRATDPAGNFSECTQTITVHDITRPVITCPSDVTLNCEDDNTPSATGTATATDICTPVANITITHTDVSTYSADPSSVLHYNYSISRIWRATDVAGNYSECTQTITVHDITQPVITCPSDVTINCEDDNAPAATGTATATDICTPVANIGITHSDVSTQSADPSALLHYNYTINRTWRATDVAGNYSECTQIITVQDVTNPVITCPADRTIDCEDDNTPAGTGVATAADNCEPAVNIAITSSDVSTQDADPANILHYNYTITRTWRATDVSGNFSECIQTITVHDITKPVITCPSDVTINCEDDNTPAGTGNATASDLCTPVSNILVTHSDLSTYDADPSNILHYNYTISRTWRATDISGNFSECTQTITVHDVSNPNFTVPPAITICRASDCSYDTNVLFTGDVTDESDNCTPGTLLNATFTDDITGLVDCDNFGFILRTWSLTDIAGNTTIKIQTIWVEPTPHVSISTTTPIICDGSNISVTINSPTISTVPSNLNYVVAVTSTDPAHLGGTASTGFTKLKADLPFTITGTLTNNSDVPIVVTYTVAPKLNGCSDGTVQSVQVTVEPTPHATISTTTPIVCNGANISVTINSPTVTTNPANLSYVVAVTSTDPAHLGGTASSGFTKLKADLPFTITGTLTNSSDVPIVVTYTVTPKLNGCSDGTVQSIQVTVEPTPHATISTTTPIVCDGANISITINSPTVTTNPADLSYVVAVTSTDPAHLGGTASTGFTKLKADLPFTITGTLTNNSDVPIVVTYTVAPKLNGCSDGTVQSVQVTVEPTPHATISTITPIVCDGANISVTINSPTVTTNPANLSYVVAVTSTDPAHLGGTASTGFTKLKADLPFTITGTLTNSSNAPIIVTYTITPELNRCSNGPIQSVTIRVNPTPQVYPSGTYPQQICNNGTTSVVLSSPSSFTSGVITFNYTVVATGGVTGFLTPVTVLSNNSVISDVLHNPTDQFQTVTYTIVPVSPTGCQAGPSKTVVFIVDPTPQVIPSITSKTICNDGITNVTLYSPSIFSEGVITFNYTVAATGGVTGFTSPVTGLPNNYVISDALHNPTDQPQSVIYTIIPVSPKCSPTDPGQIVVFIVNPTPRIYPIPANTTQCDSLTTSIRLQSPSTFSNGPVSFKYTVTSTGSVTGFTTPLTGLPNNHIIADKLINTSDHFQVVTYTIIPVSPSGCADGTSRIVTVTVNPTPRAIPNNFYPSICYTGTAHAPITTEIILTSPTVMTSGSVIFDYSVTTTGSGVIVGNTTPGVNRPINYTISNSYENNSDTIQSVKYLIIPKVDNAICVPGKRVISEVKVHARPVQRIIVTKPLTCSEGAGLAALRAVISKGANPYQIVWDGSFGYHKTDSLLISNLSSGKYVLKVTDNLGCNNKDSVSILPVSALATIQAAVIAPGNYNISCIGSTDGTILASVAGGITPPYSYSVIKNDIDTLYSGVFSGNLNLIDPTTFRYFNNLGAGSYSLFIKDVNGCENLSRIVLRVPPPIVATIKNSAYAGGFNISCKGYNDGSASVVQPVTGGRGGYTYRWYTTDGNIPGPINTDKIDNLIAGTYYLEIKDILGCSQIQSTVITEPLGMQLAGSQLSKSGDGNFNISCYGGNNGSINITVTGGSGNYIFLWTGPAGFSATTKDLTGLKAGVYTCSVRDQNGCILTPSPSFTLTEPTALVINSTTNSVSSDGAYNINCYGANTGWIHLAVSGGSTGAYTYNWTTSNGSGIVQGQRDQNALTAGTYHLVITDLNNCIVTKDVTLTQPPQYVIQLAPVNITCKSPGFNNGSINLTVTGGIAPYTYSWSNGAVSEDISSLTPGNYTVTVTDFNGCIKTGTATIELPPALAYTKSISDYNGFNISCNGLSNGFIHVDPTTGSSPFVYTWTGPGGFTSSSKNINDIKAGQYSLLIVDNNECKASDTFNLTEPEKLTINLELSQSTAGGYNINCAGDSTGYITVMPLNQVKTVDYIWSDGVFGKTRTNLAAGNYNLIITDGNNCHASESIKVTAPDSLKIQFNITPPFCPDKPDGLIETNVTGGVSGSNYSYNWSDNSTGRNLSNIPEGLFEVTVTDLNGCTATKSENVKAINETCLVIPNAISPNGDLINDVWNIGMIELYPAMEVKIFNRWGQALWRSERGYPRPWDGTSNGSALPIDSYHYIIDLHNGSRPQIGNVTIVR